MMNFKSFFILLVLIIAVTVPIYFLGLLNFILLVAGLVIFSVSAAAVFILSKIRVSCDINGEDLNVTGNVTVRWLLNLFRISISRQADTDSLQVFIAGFKIFEKSERHAEDTTQHQEQPETDDSKKQHHEITPLPEAAEVSQAAGQEIRKPEANEQKQNIEQKPPEHATAEIAEESLMSEVDTRSRDSEKELISHQKSDTLSPTGDIKEPEQSADSLTPEEELQKEYMQELETPALHSVSESEAEAVQDEGPVDDAFHHEQETSDFSKTPDIKEVTGKSKEYSSFVKVVLKIIGTVSRMLGKANDYIENRIIPFKDYYLIIHREILYTLKKIFLLIKRMYKSFSTSGIDLELVWGERDHPSELGQATALVSFVSGLLSEKIRFYFHPDFQSERKNYYINGQVSFSVFRFVSCLVRFAANPRQLLSFYRIYRHIRNFDKHFNENINKAGKRKAA
jgi:hypothetical protein